MEIKITITPADAHCKRCHFTAGSVKINFKTWKVGPPDRCPCCNNPQMDKDYKPGFGPEKDDVDVVEAYCPVCETNFFARQTWIDRIKSIKKKDREHLFPRVISQQEFIPAKQESLSTISTNRSNKSKGSNKKKK